MGNRSLEDVLKEKLVNLEKEGAVINWKDIQLQISNRKNKKKISIYYYLAAASLAGVAILLSIFFLINEKKDNGLSYNKKIIIKDSITSNKVELSDVLQPVLKEGNKNELKEHISKKENTNPPDYITYKVNSNYRVDQYLPDSSKVNLNLNAEVEFTDKINERIVHLKGEAFFNVKPDKTKPFKIKCGNAFIEVVGTSFHVKPYSIDSISVFVVEGKVKFSPSIQEEDYIFLNAGDIGLFSNGKTIKAKSVVNNELAWKTGIMKFDNTQMSEAIQIVEDYFNIKISVSNNSVLNCHLTANFKNPDLKKVLDIFSVLLKVQYKKQNDEYILTGKGCD